MNEWVKGAWFIVNQPISTLRPISPWLAVAILREIEAITKVFKEMNANREHDAATHVQNIYLRLRKRIGNLLGLPAYNFSDEFTTENRKKLVENR